MSTNRPLIPGETIPLESFPAHLKQRARLFGAMVFRADSLIAQKMDKILNTPDDDLRRVQLGDKFTYEELDEHLVKEFLDAKELS